MIVEIRARRAQRSGALLGRADITIVGRDGSGLEINGCPVFERNGHRWAGLPSEQMRDADGRVIVGSDGKPRYRSVLRWATRGEQDRFSDAVVAAIEKAGGFDGRADPPEPQRGTAR